MNLIKKNIKRLVNGSKKKYSNAVFLEFFRLNGAVIDAVEYFLYMKSIGVDIKLCVFNRFNKLYSPHVEKLHELIKDRYDIDFDYVDDIKYYERTWEFVKERFNTVLILDRMTAETFPLFNAEKVVFFHDYSVRMGTEELYDKMSGFQHIKIYHEMPFAITCKYSRKTNLKMAFSLYKKRDKVDDNYFMNLLSKGEIWDIQNALSEIENDKYLFVTYKKEDAAKLLKIRDHRLVMWDMHPSDFFSKFGTYIYIHDGHYFDPRPRMFHECAFYGKKIKYVNHHGIKDGSWYRYQEVLNDPEAVKKRTLCPDDIIIREFL